MGGHFLIVPMDLVGFWRHRHPSVNKQLRLRRASHGSEEHRRTTLSVWEAVLVGSHSKAMSGHVDAPVPPP